MSITFYSQINPGVYDEDGCLLYGIADCNFANVNARMVFDALEVEFDYAGSIPASDLLAKIGKWESAHPEQDNSVGDNYLRSRIYLLRHLCMLSMELCKVDNILWG